MKDKLLDLPRGGWFEMDAMPEQDIKNAIKLLSTGGVVAFPTETVYGLGADSRNDEAVRRIFAIKGRPNFNPLIVHVGSLEQACRIGEFNEAALKLAEAFWPGPLSIVVPLKTDAAISPLVTAGLSTIALRVPDHDVARALLNGSGLAIAAPSANSSGRISPTSHAHVLQDLGQKVDLIVDGGETKKGLESTIVMVSPSELREGEDLAPPVVKILRPGTITKQALEVATGLEVVGAVASIDEKAVDAGDVISSGGVEMISPGSLLRHYAPKALVRLNALDRQDGEGVLGFGPELETLLERWDNNALGGNIEEVHEARSFVFYNLSETGDLAVAAQRLFAGLHYMDQQGVSGIAVRPIPDEGIGVAINDRLRRAAAGSSDGSIGGSGDEKK